MRDAQTQTDCPTLTRDAEIARLSAQNDRLRRYVKYADRESQRARAAAATADELTECRMRIIQLTGYNAKLVRITELLSERVGLTTKRALPRATPVEGPGRAVDPDAAVRCGGPRADPGLNVQATPLGLGKRSDVAATVYCRPVMQ